MYLGRIDATSVLFFCMAVCKSDLQRHILASMCMLRASDLHVREMVLIIITNINADRT